MSLISDDFRRIPIDKIQPNKINPNSHEGWPK